MKYLKRKILKEDIERWEYILYRGKVEGVYMNYMLQLGKKYIDPRFNFCTACDSEVRMMIIKLKECYNTLKDKK